jgi:hypothetical protein
VFYIPFTRVLHVPDTSVSVMDNLIPDCTD